MFYRGMKTRATSFTRNWCLTNLTFFSFLGLLYSHVLPRPSSSGALSLGQLQCSQQVKHLKWQIRIFPCAIASDRPLAMLSGKRNHLGQDDLVASVRNIPLRTQTHKEIC